MKRIAFFVDWENLRLEIEHIQKEIQTKGTFSYNNSKDLMFLIKSFLEKDEDLYRIFFYTGKPWSPEALHEKINKGNYPTTDVDNFNTYFNANKTTRIKSYHTCTDFLRYLVLEDFVALRLGSMKINCIQTNGYPAMVQKQVDMLIGLDISHVSYLKLVDKIIIFSHYCPGKIIEQI